MNGITELFMAFAQYIEEEREYTGECDADHYFADKVERLEKILIEAIDDMEEINDLVESLYDKAYGIDWSAQA